MITALLTMAILAKRPSTDIDDYIQSDLVDATFVARIVRGDQNELGKINESFGESYKFPTTTIRYKEPLKLRLDANVEDTTATYILNGPIQAFKVPRLRVSTRTDLSNRPGRRQSALDFGLLAPSLFHGLYNAKFVRVDRATGDPVFDLTYANPIDTSRSRIWVDPTRRIIAKREWYNQSGRQLATFLYDMPKQFGQVWLPTELTVKNVDDKVAGVTRYESVRVNSGIEDSVFKIDR